MSSGRLVEFATNVWIVEGPVVDYYGFPYPTRMVVIRLSDGTSWIWSPIAFQQEEEEGEGDPLLQEVQATAGPARHLVSPNAIWSVPTPSIGYSCNSGKSDVQKRGFMRLQDCASARLPGI